MSDTPMTREPSPHMHDCEHGFDRTLCYCDTPEACLCDTEDDNVEAAPAPTVEPSHLQEAGAASTPMTREQAWDDLLAALKYAWSHGDADHGATLSFLRTEMERLEGERDAAATFAQNVDDLRVARIADLQAALREIANGTTNETIRNIARAALPDAEGRECPHCHAQQAGIGDRCGNCHRALPDTEGPE